MLWPSLHEKFALEKMTGNGVTVCTHNIHVLTSSILQNVKRYELT